MHEFVKQKAPPPRPPRPRPTTEPARKQSVDLSNANGKEDKQKKIWRIREVKGTENARRHVPIQGIASRQSPDPPVL